MKSSVSEATEIDARQILEALFELARADQHATHRGLASITGLGEPRVIMLLDELERLGLVDAERCRLTMPGLVLACAADRGARDQVDRAA